MTTEEPLPKKVRLSETDLKVMARDELIVRWKQYEAYVQALEDRYTDLHSHTMSLRASQEKLKQQQQASARRKDSLVTQLATKEQAIEEHSAQIQYLQRIQRLRNAHPAINFFFRKMKDELERTKIKLGDTQDELSAWKFTPASQTGKDLMVKCRMLIQENQKLGRQVSQVLIVQLEAELALQKRYGEELRSSRKELNGFIHQLEEKVDDMQSTILLLQQQLKETRQQLALYQEQQPQAPAPRASRATSEPRGQAEAPGTGKKASNNSEGSETAASPTGSVNSPTRAHHCNGLHSNHDPLEEKLASRKGN